jgi:hypothetical protein
MLKPPKSRKKKRKLTPEENIAINSQIPSRSKTVIFARAHKHMLIVNDPALFH